MLYGSAVPVALEGSRSGLTEIDRDYLWMLWTFSPTGTPGTVRLADSSVPRDSRGES